MGFEFLIHACDVVADIGLVGPVVEILGGQHVAVVSGRHILGEDALRQSVADGVAGRIPAVVGCQAINHLVLVEAVDQGVIRAVGKGHIDEADRDIEVDRLFNLVQEVFRRLEHDREVFKICRFRRRCSQRRIDGEQEIRPFIVDNRAANGFDVRGNGLADGLSVIARDRLFSPAQGVDDGNFRMIIIEVVAGSRNEQQSQLVGAGEGTEGCLRNALAGHFEILRF